MLERTNLHGGPQMVKIRMEKKPSSCFSWAKRTKNSNFMKVGLLLAEENAYKQTDR